MAVTASTQPRSAVVLGASIVAAIAGAVLVARIVTTTNGSKHDDGGKNRSKRGNTDHTDSATRGKSGSTAAAASDFEEELPPHVKRELHKERRRKESVRFLAMKRPMYDNIEMYSQAGEILCTISKKKANWYINKEIAIWKNPQDQSAIQLLFDPKGQSEKTLYTVSQKNNICVSCGDDRHFMRHYVVPYCYRTLLPQKYKSHTPHDIVLMCPDCHLSCEQATQARQKRMENRLRKDPATKPPLLKDRRLHHIRSISLAVWKHAEQIPEAVLQRHRTEIRKHFRLPDDADIPAELLEEGSRLETHTPNPKYVPGADLVAAALQTEEDIEAFIVGWRKHFLSVVKPRYMPIGWSAESPVHSDVREKE